MTRPIVSVPLRDLSTTNTPAIAARGPAPATVGRGLAWLLFLIYLTCSGPLRDAEAIFGCTGFSLLIAAHGWQADFRLGGIKQLMSLANGVWLGLLLYALPIYALSAISDISTILDVDPRSLAEAAKMTFVSIAITGLCLEALRPWATAIHHRATARLKLTPREHQYYVALGLTIAYAYNYATSGVVDVLASGSRILVTQTFESGKMWLIQYLMTGASIAFVCEHLNSSSRKRLSFYVGFASVMPFWLMYLSLGNRRGVLTIVLATIVCYLARSKNAKRAAIILLLAFTAGGAIGMLRQDSSSHGDQATFVALTNFFGEFIYPSYTLVHTIELGRAASLDFTWLTVLYDFAWAQISGQQFAFLAHRFALEVAPAGSESVMGFAYLPITEAYQAFGPPAAAISGAVLLTTVLSLAWLMERRSWIYVLLFSLVLDMNRAEFGAMVVEFLLIAGGYAITAKVKL